MKGRPERRTGSDPAAPDRAGAEEADLLGLLSEPEWWDGGRPLLEMLREMYAAVRAESLAALRRLPDSEGIPAQPSAPAAPSADATPAPRADPPAAEAAAPPEARPRPLMLPGLAEALGVEPSAPPPRRRR